MTVTTPFDDGDMFSGIFDDSSSSPPSAAEPSRSGTGSLANLIFQSSAMKTTEIHSLGTKDGDDFFGSDDEASHTSSAAVDKVSTVASSSDNKKSTKTSHSVPNSKSSSSRTNAASLSKRLPVQANKKKTTKPPPILSSKDSPNEFSPPSDLSRRSDIFKLPVPIPQDVLETLESLSPLDWSDSFSFPFHHLMDKFPNSWKELCEKFEDVTSAKKLQHFLSCDLGSTPLAFLGVDRRGKIRLLHNLAVAPNTGTFVNPVPIFLGLSQASFESPPIWIDPEDIDALLLNVEYEDVPSASEILMFCSFDEHSKPSKTRDPKTPPSFRFDPIRFGNLKKPSTESDEAASSFSCKGLFPLHPALSGLLLHHFHSQDLGSSRCSAPFLASMIFKFLIQRWTVSTPLDSRLKTSTVPMSHSLFKSSLDLFRFLWFAHHKYPKAEWLSVEVSPNYDEARTFFVQHTSKLFPSLRSIPNDSLPPIQDSGPVPQPPGVAPSFTNNAVPNVQSPSTGVSADTIYMTEKLSERFSSAISEHTTKLTRDKDEEKKEIFKHTTHLRNAIVFGQVGPSDSVLPSSPSEIASELFRQKSTHTLYSTIHARVFRKSDNACYILFGQCGVLQKFGLRWRGNDHPSGFSPFSFDPYCCSGPDSHLALDHDIQHDIYECSLRSDNGLSTKDMRDIFVNE